MPVLAAGQALEEDLVLFVRVGAGTGRISACAGTAENDHGSVGVIAVTRFSYSRRGLALRRTWEPWAPTSN
ncbi:hypothetical protein [Streptomyces sp. NPDC050804]|uniref:hypothetical protein n=1 Tax=Streptomyces sp. NPDC050804 TaxID=3154745 RepID=UPI0034231B1C